MSKSRPALNPHKLRYLTWGDIDINSTTAMGTQAVAVNCIDSTGATTVDGSLTVDTSEGTVTITMDASETTSDGVANQITLSTSTLDNDEIADLLILAVAGTTNSRIAYATSGAGTAGLKGIDAAEGSSSTEITLTKSSSGSAGNASAAITRVSGDAGLVQNAAGANAAASFIRGSNARSWVDSLHPLRESDSGAIVLVSAAATANRTFTLPSAKKGLNFKFVWGVQDNGNFFRAIKTAAATETFRGTVIAIATKGSTEPFESEQDIVTNLLAGEDEIQIVDDCRQGSWVEVVSDGEHWYVVDSSILNVTENSDAAVAFA